LAKARAENLCVSFIPNAWQVPASMWFDEDKAVEAFRTGKGIAWGDHDGRLYCGVAAFYRNAYRASLVAEWLPALDGVVDKLEQGIAVADVGCGHGHSTMLMAEAYPNSVFHGFDTHGGSIWEARNNAREAGLDARLTYEVADAGEFPGRGYGLICLLCTTWATRCRRRNMPHKRSQLTAPCSWSSLSQTTASRTTTAANHGSSRRADVVG
jgi:hypothetical protein